MSKDIKELKQCLCLSCGTFFDEYVKIDIDKGVVLQRRVPCTTCGRNGVPVSLDSIFPAIQYIVKENEELKARVFDLEGMFED